MTADDLMRLINRYVEACDDLGEGLFEKPLTTTDALHAKATALHGQILDEVYRLHALAAAQPPAAPAQAGPIPGVTTDAELAGLEAAADAAGLSVEWYELRLELQHLRTARQAVGEAFEKWRDRADPEQMAMMLASPTPPQPVEPTP